jgi:hypothetical protein
MQDITRIVASYLSIPDIMTATNDAGEAGHLNQRR